MGVESSRQKIVKGKLYKLCSGPGHDEPTWLPATEKYFYRQRSRSRGGKLHYYCHLCANWNRLKSPGESGTVLLSKAHPFFLEAVHRVGLSEVSRRTGLSQSAIANIVNARQDRVQKRTLRKLMLELISMRRKDEVWHKDSIYHGAKMRGRKVKKAKDRGDFYRSHGDLDNERRKAWRNENTDRENAQAKRRREAKKKAASISS